MRFFAFALILFASATVEAANINVQRRDMKLATQQLIEKYISRNASGVVTAPEASDDDQLLGATTVVNGATSLQTTFLAQPDVTRNIIVTPGGTTTSIAAGNVVVTGTDIHGKALTENIALINNQNTVATGTRAFRTVASVLFPAGDGTGATLLVGTGDRLGVHRCMETAGDFIQASHNGAFEATRPTLTVNSSVVAANTIDLNTAYDGSGVVRAYFMQNFACLP